MSKRMRVPIGGIVLVLMLALFGSHLYSMLVPPKGSNGGWSGQWLGEGEPTITDVDPASGATDLRSGDELIAINGIRVRQQPKMLDYGDDVPAGTRYTMTIRRAGELREVGIQTVPHKFHRRFDPLLALLLPFLLTGWIVFLLKPDDKQAHLLVLMLGTLMGLMGQNPANLPDWLSVIVGIARASGLLFLPILVHFFLIFPDRSPLLSRWPRLEYLLYLPCLLLILPVLGPGRLSMGLALRLSTIPWASKAVMMAVSLIAVYLAAGLVCLAINYQAANPIARRKLRVVMAGSGAGFFNLFLLVGLEVVKGQNRLGVVWTWLDRATFITFPLIPLSFVYAILRHKVIPVSLIIRRGVRYVLVSRGSILLQVAIVGILMYLVMDGLFRQLPGLTGRTVGVISGIVGIVIWNLNYFFYRHVLGPAIDRRFFRRSYDARQIMADLADSLRATTSLPQLCEQVATRIQTALQTESVVVLLRDEATGDYLSAYSCEYEAGKGTAIACQQQFRLPSHAEAIARLQENGQPIEIESRSGETDELNQIEEAALKAMKSSLLLPLMSREGMPGIISLGARLGDLPFSREDKDLLMSVAGPTTFAIENTRLIERTIAEVRRREEIEAENEQRARELEEARQLQLSMLPKTVPQMPHLEIAAYMKTATEVGGDYYDFHLSDSRELTIVVGDATGHGLKAGTVVTATKSLFNHLASMPDMTEIFRHSSRALKLMNLRALYMAMTMVKIRGYHMKVSAAGMPSVLVYRNADHSVEEILIKGIPLGSMSNYAYREEDVNLSPGDVVVLMSDGFPERFNRNGEMLEYAKAGEVLIENAHRSSQAIIERFIAVGDQWADGQPQDDDVTFVVVKVC